MHLKSRAATATAAAGALRLVDHRDGAGGFGHIAQLRAGHVDSAHLEENELAVLRVRRGRGQRLQRRGRRARAGGGRDVGGDFGRGGARDSALECGEGERGGSLHARLVRVAHREQQRVERRRPVPRSCLGGDQLQHARPRGVRARRAVAAEVEQQRERPASFGRARRRRRRRRRRAAPLAVVAAEVAAEAEKAPGLDSRGGALEVERRLRGAAGVERQALGARVDEPRDEPRALRLLARDDAPQRAREHALAARVGRVEQRPLAPQVRLRRRGLRAADG